MKYLCLILFLCFTLARASAQENTEQTLSVDSIITKNGALDSLFRSLPEVMVMGERPIVKATQGKLLYDVPRLIRNLPVDNAYDAIKELPGVAEMDGALTLAGKSVTVILNGQVTTMSASQFYTLLKSIPASRIENAEVMYNAPARYQVRGALINITLKQNTGKNDSWQGELYGKYAQEHYEDFEERASFNFNHDKLSADFLYSHVHGRAYRLTEKDALHTLADGNVTPINTNETWRNRSHTHNLRIGADYNFGKSHRLSAVYTGAYSTSHSYGTVAGTQHSSNQDDGDDQLHNGRIDYQAPFGLRAGAELTYYHSPSNQTLSSEMLGERIAFRSSDSQRINAWKFFLSQEHKLGNGWGMNYGVTYTTSVDHSHQYYTDTESDGPDIPTDMTSRRREQMLNLYAGFNKSFGKLSVDASLAAERYKTPVWNQWDWYPVVNITYMLSPTNLWQLSLSSDKTYPDYWAVQDVTSYLGGSYSEIQGNPLLKPTQKYNLSLTYVLRGKYVFSVWFQHAKDYSAQTLYQSSQKLMEIYKYLNFDYAQQSGVQATLPFKAGNWLDSRLSLIGVWQHEKDADFYDIPFNRAIFWGMARLTNTFTLSTKPDLKLTLSGMIRSLAHQGIYDLPPSGNVNASLRYVFARGNAIVNLYANDIFKTGGISPRIRFKTQYVTNHYATFRQIGVSFTYKFGGYKERQREEVDRSRFK
ncbi:MAG: outer membrane beta-barrel family protein [Mediterranea sp.]|nr:outer membrane beta-barrel family protein [Mediterranea sp.]